MIPEQRIQASPYINGIHVEFSIRNFQIFLKLLILQLLLLYSLVLLCLWEGEGGQLL